MPICLIPKQTRPGISPNCADGSRSKWPATNFHHDLSRTIPEMSCYLRVVLEWAALSYTSYT